MGQQGRGRRLGRGEPVGGRQAACAHRGHCWCQLGWCQRSICCKRCPDLPSNPFAFPRLGHPLPLQITRVTLRIHEMPGPATYIIYGSNPERRVDAVMAFQGWLPNADRRYGGAAKLDATFQSALLFMGPWKDALAGLQDAGLLDPTILNNNTGVGFDSQGNMAPPGTVPAGVFVVETPSYALGMVLVSVAVGGQGKLLCASRASHEPTLSLCLPLPSDHLRIILVGSALQVCPWRCLHRPARRWDRHLLRVAPNV